MKKGVTKKIARTTRGVKKNADVRATTPGVFDAALPAALCATSQENADRHVAIHRVKKPSVSPYVIRLARGEERPLVPQHSPADIAASLIFDDEEDDITMSTQDDTRVTSRDLQPQLRETDRVVRGVRARTPLPTRETSLTLPLRTPFTEMIDVDDLLDFSALEEDALPPRDEPSTSYKLPATTLFLLTHGQRRALAGFMALSFALVLPLEAMQGVGNAVEKKDDISAIGLSAIDNVERGASAFADARYGVAQDEFSRATEKFSEAQQALEDMHAALAAVVNVMPQTKRTYDSVSGLIAAGRELSTIASTMSAAAETVAPQSAITVVTKLELLATAVDDALTHADIAAHALADVDATLVPDAYAEKVAALKKYVPQLSASLHEFTSFAHALATMLGGNGAMRYLVAFQNPTELRPTGGFIGSFAEVNLRNGEIADMRIPGGGSYATQGQLTKFVASPAPLGIIDPRWEMQDANWFPDFPSSARKLQWFYENANGPSTDGVIAVNATFVVELLRILGPIDMPKYGRTIDAENFMFEAQKIVEFEYDKTENAPKAFIGDMAPLLLDRIAQAPMPTFLKVLTLVGSSFEQKNIQLYFADDDLEAAVQDLGWSGTMQQTSGDYLMVVNTNLGGGKTDAVIDQHIDDDVVIGEDGSVTHTLTITKTHHGIANALFSGRNNVDYLRVYTPEGSELVSADGFEAPLATAFEMSSVPLGIDEDLQLAMSNIDVDATSGTDSWNENGKTVFGNWMQTAPGETQVVHLTYRLPAGTFDVSSHGLWATAKERLGVKNTMPYTLFVQKQSGADTRVTNVRVTLPESMMPIWVSHEGLGTDVVTVPNTTDTFLRLLAE